MPTVPCARQTQNCAGMKKWRGTETRRDVVNQEENSVSVVENSATKMCKFHQQGKTPETAWNVGKIVFVHKEGDRSSLLFKTKKSQVFQETTYRQFQHVSGLCGWCCGPVIRLGGAAFPMPCDAFPSSCWVVLMFPLFLVGQSAWERNRRRQENQNQYKQDNNHDNYNFLVSKLLSKEPFSLPPLF